VNTSALPDGLYTVTATATDLAGNSAVTPVRSFRVDTTAPVVTITQPAAGSTTANQRPTISGTTEPGATVVITVFAQTITVTADAVTGAFTAPLGFDLPNGTYQISITATDAAGNVSQPATRSFTVDTTALPLTLTAPAQGAALSTLTPTIQGTTAPNTQVTITVRDSADMVVATLMATSNAAGEFSVTTMALVEGSYVATASVRTAANVETTDTTNFTLDVTPPALSLIAPAADAALNNPTPVISGTSEPGAELQIEILDAAGNTVETITVTVGMNGQYSVTPTQPLTDGDYTITAVAADRAGNTTTVGPRDLTIDTVAPTLTVTAPNADEVLPTRDVAVTGTSDAGQLVVIELRNANGMIVSTQQATADAMGAWSATFTNTADGDYTLHISATDAAGNTTAETLAFSVDSDEPTLTLTSPANGPTNTASLPIVGSADADATIVVTVRDAAGNIVTTQTIMPEADGSFSDTLTMALADGAYTVEVVSTRPNGLGATETRNVVVDTTPPVTVISQPGDGSTIGSTTPTINGTSEPGASVEIFIDGMLVGTVVVGQDGTWSFDVTTPLAQGDHVVRVVATDAAGNVGQAVERPFVVDTSVPMVTLTSPMEGQRVTSTQPTITGTATPGTTIEILIDGQAVGTVTADAMGMWSFTPSAPLSVGDHTIEARVTNAAGASATTGVVNFTVRPNAELVITSPAPGGSVTGPSVTVTGTGEPGSTVTVVVGGREVTVVVGDDGSWSVTIDELPAGDATIVVTDDLGNMVTIMVNVTIDGDGPLSGGILAGDGCDCSQPGNGKAPDVGGLLLLAFGVMIMRRRRAA
jgi:hypothetical protein